MSDPPEVDASAPGPRAPGPDGTVPAGLAGERLLAVLQFADGLFPAGGFAHSLGLETYTAEGRIHDVDGLAEFVQAYLELSAGPADAVAAAGSGRAGHRSDLGGCADLDGRLDAMKWVPESRDASLQMGRQTARVAAALASDAFTSALARAVADGAMPGHHAVIFGAVLGAHGVADEAIAGAYLHGTAVQLVNAALRLMPLGQLEGQRLLAGVRPLIARLAREAARQDARTMWSFTAGLELAGLRHAGLDMRLFRS